MKVLITGATSGIGYEFAKIFAENGDEVILVGRNKEKLAAIKNEIKGSRIILKDLSSMKAADEIFKELKGEDIDALVNNAGFGAYGRFSETDVQNELDMMQVNMVALTHLTKLFLPGMLHRKSGRILNVASTAAFLPGPLMSVYYASKAYVLSFSLALHEELRGTGVTVTVLCPGPTKSEFQKRANIDHHMMHPMEARKVALEGYHAMMKGRKAVIPGFANKLIAEFVKLIPMSMQLSMVKRMQQKRS